MIKHSLNIYLYTKDIIKSTEFYGKLGFDVESSNEVAVVRFTRSKTDIELVFITGTLSEGGHYIEIPDINFGNEVIFYMDVENKSDLFELAKNVKNAGDKILLEPYTRMDGEYTYIMFDFFDLDNHQWMVTYKGLENDKKYSSTDSCTDKYIRKDAKGNNIVANKVTIDYSKSKKYFFYALFSILGGAIGSFAGFLIGLFGVFSFGIGSCIRGETAPDLTKFRIITVIFFGLLGAIILFPGTYRR
jgi:predicted lactoylglutathione lyase